jgi:16S rRNA (guanine527-N7)-methyltransferase
MSDESELAHGLAGLGLDLPAPAAQKLLAYRALLLKWNRVYNLTAIRAPHHALTHHLLDSLAVLPFLAAVGRLADVGSGGGLPGIPLAIARPTLDVSSIETVGKKASFQQQAKIELGLSNFMVLNERVENVRSAEAFDAVISRAFSSLAEFAALTRHLLRPGGRWLAMKGGVPEDEIAALPPDIAVVAVHPLRVPGLDAERNLIVMEPR